eukprot:2763099-Prymnesium_polylepis.1
MVLVSDGVQTVGGNDNTAIWAATKAKDSGTKLIVVGFGDASLVTLSYMASWPASTYARYKATAAELYEMLTNGEFA